MRPPLSRQTTEVPARTHAHDRALCCSPSLPPLSCTCLVCESGVSRMQLEPQLLVSQRDVAQTSTDSVLRDSRALSRAVYGHATHAHDLDFAGDHSRAVAVHVDEWTHLEERHHVSLEPCINLLLVVPQLERSEFVDRDVGRHLVHAVVIVIKREMMHDEEGMIPVILPMGTFTWTVKPILWNTRKPA